MGNDKFIMNNESDSRWKTLFHHLPGGTEESHVKFHSV